MISRERSWDAESKDLVEGPARRSQWADTVSALLARILPGDRFAKPRDPSTMLRPLFLLRRAEDDRRAVFSLFPSRLDGLSTS